MVLIRAVHCRLEMYLYSNSCEVFWRKGRRSRLRVSELDFQLARNLSAIARAQEEISQAILHIDSMADCLNREIVMAAARSNAQPPMCGAVSLKESDLVKVILMRRQPSVEV